MAAAKLRKIVVDNETFLWNRRHIHSDNRDLKGCTEKVTIYLEGFKNSPLFLFFHEEDNKYFKEDIKKEKWCVGYPDDGVIWLLKYKPSLPNKEANPEIERDTPEINLNRPAIIRKLIEYYFSKYWVPKSSRKPLTVNRALELLDLIDFPSGINNENES